MHLAASAATYAVQRHSYLTNTLQICMHVDLAPQPLLVKETSISIERGSDAARAHGRPLLAGSLGTSLAVHAAAAVAAMWFGNMYVEPPQIVPNQGSAPLELQLSVTSRDNMRSVSFDVPEVVVDAKPLVDERRPAKRMEANHQQEPLPLTSAQRATIEHSPQPYEPPLAPPHTPPILRRQSELAVFQPVHEIPLLEHEELHEQPAPDVVPEQSDRKTLARSATAKTDVEPLATAVTEPQQLAAERALPRESPPELNTIPHPVERRSAQINLAEIESQASVASRPDASGANVLKPVARTTPVPTYPLEQLRDGREGDVWLYVTIGTDGRVTDAHVHRSSGIAAFDESALRTVRDSWRFTPAKQGGRTVAYEATLGPIRFRIRSR